MALNFKPSEWNSISDLPILYADFDFRTIFHITVLVKVAAESLAEVLQALLSATKMWWRAGMERFVLTFVDDFWFQEEPFQFWGAEQEYNRKIMIIEFPAILEQILLCIQMILNHILLYVVFKRGGIQPRRSLNKGDKGVRPNPVHLYIEFSTEYKFFVYEAINSEHRISHKKAKQFFPLIGSWLRS